MNLSILIPAYNWDCSRLVQDLLAQLPEDAEIIVGNDRSTCPTARKRLSTDCRHEALPRL